MNQTIMNKYSTWDDMSCMQPDADIQNTSIKQTEAAYSDLCFSVN